MVFAACDQFQRWTWSLLAGEHHILQSANYNIRQKNMKKLNILSRLKAIQLQLPNARRTAGKELLTVCNPGSVRRAWEQI